MSPALVPCSVSIVPFYFRVGDHRAFIVDFPYEILLESNFIPMVKPEMRRLVSYQEKAMENYLTKGKELFERHNMLGKVN